MFSAWTTPRDNISSASSSRSTPVLYPGWRPSTVAITRSPAAVIPSAVRGWSWSAEVGRGEMDVSPSRTMSSRPPTASRTFSHPGVIEKRERQGIARLERVERRPRRAVQHDGVRRDRDASGRGTNLEHDRLVRARRGERERDAREHDVGATDVLRGRRAEAGRIQHEALARPPLVDPVDRPDRPVGPGDGRAHEDVPDERAARGIHAERRPGRSRRGHQLPRLDVDPVRRELRRAVIAGPHVPVDRGDGAVTLARLAERLAARRLEAGDPIPRERRLEADLGGSQAHLEEMDRLASRAGRLDGSPVVLHAGCDRRSPLRDVAGRDGREDGRRPLGARQERRRGDGAREGEKGGQRRDGRRASARADGPGPGEPSPPMLSPRRKPSSGPG